MSRTGLLVGGLLVAGGIWVAQHWEEVRLAAGIEEPTELRAIDLAKNDFSMEGGRKNFQVVAARAAESAADVEELGWFAHARNDHVFLVQFCYRAEDEPHSFDFEVDVGSTAVKFVGEDTEPFHVPATPPGRDH